MKRATTIGLGVACLGFAILSARLGIPVLAFGVVAMAIVAMVLCAWNKLDTAMIPVLVFLLGLAFLYQTTLISDALIGIAFEQSGVPNLIRYSPGHTGASLPSISMLILEKHMSSIT